MWRISEIEKARYFNKMNPNAKQQSKRIRYSVRFWKNRVVVCVNNYCNLRCYSCASLCHIPMGSNSFRDKPRNTLPAHLDLFLDRIKSYRKNAWVRFVGGEPMMSPYIEELVDVAHKWGRKTSILTNGHRLVEHDPFIFNHIHLDDHGTNTKTIKQCINYLESKGFKNYKISRVHAHRDLSFRRSRPPKGRCNIQKRMELLTLWQEVVYPCCSMHYVEGWDNHTKGTDLLIEAGWHVNNPDLSKVLTNWKQHFPNKIFNVVCRPGCWKLRPKEGPWKNLLEWEKNLIDAS